MHYHCGPEGSDRSDRSDRGWESRRRHRRRKERILHTRVSDTLAEDIRRVAEDLRVPMSNLVRNVLEEAFSVVERVTDDVGELVDEVIDEAERARDRMERSYARRRRHRRTRAHEEPARDAPTREADASGPGVPPEPVEGPEFPEVVAWQVGDRRVEGPEVEVSIHQPLSVRPILARERFAEVPGPSRPPVD